jgi:large subunit ribosomal protein L24
MKLKKGDKVMVIAGKAKGETGTISRVFVKQDKVVIDGVNMGKRHRRATQQARRGQIIDMAMPIHVSNVQIIDPKSGKPSRIKINRDEKKGRTRVAVKSGETIK